MRRLATAGVMVMAALAALASQRGEWAYLGEAHVDGGVDHDRIVVTAGKGSFQAIRLRVENSAIVFDHVVAHYGDGQSYPIVLRRRISGGGQTRVIALPGRHRVIESVEFWYQRGNWANPRRPKLVLLGLR
jgi:hypothetical protein